MECEGHGVHLGKSLIVPSVQELAKTGCLKELPNRYLRTDEEPLKSRAGDVEDGQGGGEEEFQVPIINMEALFSGDDVELNKLHVACKDWGFFQLINHGMSSSLVDKFKIETEEFLKLPVHEKEKYWQTPTNLEGFGQAFVVSEDQKLDWADMFYVTSLPKHWRKPHLLPMLPLPYRDTMESYTGEVQKLARKILGYMAKALNIDTDSETENNNVFGEGHQTLRMNYYPPCPEPEKTIGFTSHTDSTVLVTILLQLNEVQGLQVYHNNKWIAITPLPGAFVVNIGDVMEIMSNGIYKSVLHRAVVNAEKERISVAAFHSPKIDHEVGPIASLITSSNPAKFKRILMSDYWNAFFSRPLDGRRGLDLLRI